MVIDLSVLMYSPDGNIGKVYESIQNSIGDFSFKFITTGPVRPNYKCSEWYESYLKPVTSLQKLLYQVQSNMVTVITHDAVYEPLALSRLLSVEYSQKEEGITVVRGNDQHTFLPLSWTGYLTEIGGFDCEHPTVVDGCNDLVTRVFMDQRRVKTSSSRDVTFRMDHMKGRNTLISPLSSIVNLDNWKYV